MESLLTRVCDAQREDELWEEYKVLREQARIKIEEWRAVCTQMQRVRAKLFTVEKRPHGIATPREYEVLTMLQDDPDLANKEIAQRLGVSERTIKMHISNLFLKVGVTSRHQLVGKY